MTILLTEKEIASMVSEPKQASADLRNISKIKTKHGHKEMHFNALGDSQNEFRIILRQSNVNYLDFSIILAVRLPQSTKIFRLLRYNGKSHQHTNHIESEKFFDYHIHYATERYQNSGAREDTFAKPTNRYNDIYGAIGCLVIDANIVNLSGPQRMLFR